MNNSKEIFELAIGIESPWFIEKVEFKTEGNSRELHININFTEGHKLEHSDGSFRGAQ